jgi:hypothetical protein
MLRWESNSVLFSFESVNSSSYYINRQQLNSKLIPSLRILTQNFFKMLYRDLLIINTTPTTPRPCCLVPVVFSTLNYRIIEDNNKMSKY